MAMCQHHKLLGISRHSAFVYLMQQFPEYRYLFYYRLPFWIRHLLNIVLRRRDMRISCVCGGGVIIEHGWSTIISAKTVGSHFMVHQNCTIGWNHGGSPTIGNNVKIYTGAVVVGPISIGNNVTIGANCVVLTDVPDNTICYGNPCVMRKKSNDN